MQLRRLDPLVNASTFQRLLRNPVKSMSLTEAQYERARALSRGLIITEGESAVIGLPIEDALEVHYAFPDIEAFVELFPEMFEMCVSASSKAEAPRGLRIAFRDRPNRMTADTVFWSVALEPGEQWVELNLVAVPEQPEPSDELAGGYKVADASDDAALSDVEAAVTGLPRLSAAGLASLRENSKLLRLVKDQGGSVAGVVSGHTEPGGWGVIDHLLLKEGAEGARGRALEWAIAWLRNNGGRRMRKWSLVDDTPELNALKALGFTPGEVGFYLTRSVDRAEVDAKLAARKSHGTMIKFGDWR